MIFSDPCIESTPDLVYWTRFTSTETNFFAMMPGVGNIVLVFSTLSQYLTAVAASPVEERAQNVCQAGVYGQVIPIFQHYTPAQVYCAKAYPIKCSDGKAKQKRIVRVTPSAILVEGPTSIITRSSTQSSSTSKAASNSKDIVWSKMVKDGGSVISTVCSCIQTAAVGSLACMIR